MRNKIKLISINILTTIFLLFGLELIAHTLLKVERKSRNITLKYEKDQYIKYKNTEKSFKLNKNSKNWKLIDENRIFFRTNCKSNKLLKTNYNVLVSGGSTTDPLSTQHSGVSGTWLDHFFKLASEENLCIDLYVVAYSGFNGESEVNALKYAYSKLLKDLEGKLYVVTLSGVNEIFIGESTNIREIKAITNLSITKLISKVFRVTNKFLDSNQINNDKEFNKKISESYLTKVQAKTNSDKWINSHLEGSNFFDKKHHYYYLFLQPTLGLDQNPFFLRREIIKIGSDLDKAFISTIFAKGYFNGINLLYSNLRNECEKYIFCFDKSKNINLNSQINLYADYVHPNSEGNKIIANFIFKKLKLDFN